jgi:hypothetical protein
MKMTCILKLIEINVSFAAYQILYDRHRCQRDADFILTSADKETDLDPLDTEEIVIARHLGANREPATPEAIEAVRQELKDAFALAAKHEADAILWS